MGWRGATWRGEAAVWCVVTYGDARCVVRCGVAWHAPMAARGVAWCGSVGVLWRDLVLHA